MMQQFNEFSGNNAPKQESFEDIDVRLQNEINTLNNELESVKGLIDSLKRIGKTDIGEHINEQRSLERRISEKRKEQIQNLFNSGAQKIATTGGKNNLTPQERDAVYAVNTGTNPWEDVEERANKSDKRPDDFEKISANDRNFKGDNDNWSHVGMTGR